MAKLKIFVTLTGPAGAGKSEHAKRLTTDLNNQGRRTYHQNTGTMYRLVGDRALLLANGDINAAKEVKPIQVIQTLLGSNPILSEGVIYLNDTPIDPESLRTPEHSDLASFFGTKKLIRDILNELFRDEAARSKAEIIVVDARDAHRIHTPTVEFYLNVSDEESARRHNQPLEVIRARNLQDRTREADPLVQTESAIPIETDGRTKDEVYANLRSHIDPHL